MAIVPARKRESRAQCPCVVFQLQKSAGSILAPNKLVRSAPKRVAVRVNGGLARHTSRRESVGQGVERKGGWRVGLHAFLEKREGPAETQDDVRASFSGRDIAHKAVARSRDRGCNGHRILRRVLVGGRHLGLSRAISFHEAVVTATLAASSRGKGVTLARANAEEGDAKALRIVPRKRKRRQRCQRLDRFAGAVGRQRPRSELTYRRRYQRLNRGKMAGA